MRSPHCGAVMWGKGINSVKRGGGMEMLWNFMLGLSCLQ